MIFARGSEAKFDSREAKTFFESMDKNFLSGVRRDRVELGNLDGDNTLEDGEYRAVPVGDWVGLDIGAYFDAEKTPGLGGYNKSRSTGTDELVKFLSKRAGDCPNETFILGGYSQGAHVIGAAVPSLPASVVANIGYIALFGDPKFNPGGALTRLFGGKASWTRGDFHWYQDGGILSPRNPYLTDVTIPRTGSWCDKNDGFCTGNPLRIIPGLNNAHFEYPDNEMLQAANEVSLALKAFRPEFADNLKVTPIPINLRPNDKVDVAFVVDTTGSMGDDIAAAQASINHVTDALFGVAKSARVTLVDYKDVGDAYQARVDAPFTADRAAFAAAVNGLSASGGGDTPESVYSGLMTAFGLDWRPGALKLAIVIGDAPAKNPEPVTNYTLDQVLKTAFELDPVVINPIVVGGDPLTTTSFTELATGSKGRVFNAGQADQVVQAITEAVEGFTTAPVANAGGPYTAAPGEEIPFTAAGSFDPDGVITQYAWDFDADGTADQTSDSPTALHTYASPYTGLASVTVTANDGRQSVGTAEVTVAAGQHTPRPPSSPQSFVAAAESSDSIKLTWKAPAEAGAGPVGGYRLLRDDGTSIGLVTADKLSFTVTGVPNDREVKFGIEALNEFGASESTTSNPLRLGATTTSPPTSTTRSESPAPTTTATAPGGTPGATPKSPGALSYTGANVAVMAAIAGLVVLAGIGLRMIARRRRNT